MSRSSYAGPKLPQTLLDQVGGKPVTTSHVRQVSRKDKRQAERQPKSNARVARTRDHATARISGQHGKPTRVAQAPARPTTKALPQASVGATRPPKSILKKPTIVHKHEETSSSEEDGQEEESEPVVSRAVRTRLEEDDAEIAALEKKLGIKNKSSKALQEDGLDWITNGGDDSASDSSDVGTKRRRQEDDMWLQNKRQKADVGRYTANGVPDDTQADDDDDTDDERSDSDSGMEDLQNPFSDDEMSDDDFGFSSASGEDENNRVKTRVRENPYVAPVTSGAKDAPKYVPPSLRRAQLAGKEDLTQLKRQLQGQLNRLSDANFLSILQGVEEIYEKNARQHVSSTLIDILSSMVNTVSTLSENFLILHAGFAAAVFKVTGPAFTAALLENFTTAIDDLRTSRQPGKQVLNLVGFLANAYVLQMIGPSIIFDYIRTFLHDLSEDNTELLLRVVRTAGMQLRSDDPTALKDIVLLLTRSVAQRGQDTLSVRTKFMIETINDLKNNRMKTNITASGITSEHIVRMRKLLGSLNTRGLLATEPLQITLSDIRDSEKNGKWWLVGASYHDPAKLSHNHPASTQQENPASRFDDDGYESETPGHVSLQKLARSQGMNTDVRRSIFISVMSATDFEDAHLRIAKLNLKNKQVVEVPKVLLHCAGAESNYNPYYTIVARRLCGEKRLQKAFQSTLWDTLRKLDVSANTDEAEGLSLSSIVNLGRLYGTLMADGCLSLSSLKTVELTYPSEKLQAFAEVLFTTIMARCSKQKEPSQSLRRTFSEVALAPGMITGLRIFLEKTLSSADIASTAKERKAVRDGCRVAIQTLSEVAASAPPDVADMSMSDDEL